MNECNYILPIYTYINTHILYMCVLYMYIDMYTFSLKVLIMLHK